MLSTQKLIKANRKNFLILRIINFHEKVCQGGIQLLRSHLGWGPSKCERM